MPRGEFRSGAPGDGTGQRRRQRRGDVRLTSKRLANRGDMTHYAIANETIARG